MSPRQLYAESKEPASEAERDTGSIVDTTRAIYHHGWSNRFAPDIIGRLVGTFDWYDLSGIMHPTPHSTQYNWSKRGLYVTFYYKDNGIADILAFCTREKTWLKFLEVMAND